jgi:DNA-binding LacI/PurR family transcriptional regulator/DNA-binding GntR family transcriptional regulator
LTRKKRGMALEQAVAFLIQYLAQTDSKQSVRLPSITMLAKKAGSTQGTMWRAVCYLQNKGCLVTVPGGGIFTAQNRVPVIPFIKPVTTVADTAPQKSWERIADTISNEILTGRIKHDSILPSLKEFSLRYNVTNRTVAQALRSLEEEKLLVKKGHGYTTSLLPIHHQQTTLVLITHTSSMGALSSITTRARTFWHSLERECIHYNIKPEIYGLFDEPDVDENALRKRCEKIVKSTSGQPVAGFLFWALAKDPAPLRIMLECLKHTHLPVAIIDESGGTLEIAAEFKSSQFRFLNVGTTDVSGLMVGRYLLRLGHRKVAFFCPNKNDPSYKRRLNGIRKAFNRGGTLCTVYEFAHDAYDSYETVGELVSETESSRFAQREILRIKQHFNIKNKNKPLMMFLENNNRALEELVAMNVHLEIMTPLFAKALNNNSITAWVGYNDRAALAAQSFLSEKRIKVPEAISIVGFDDIPQTFGSGLTSYNFNMSRVVELLIEHILSPRSRRGANQMHSMELPGFIAERETSAPPLPDRSR